MNDTLTRLRGQIQRLEHQLEDELSKRADELRYRISNGKVIFEKEVLARQRAFRVSVIRYIADAKLLVILTAPVIYSLIIPIVLLDLFVTLFQLICFPVYKIPKVRRKDYLVFDRVKLSYLNYIEKLNCLYCSYCGGIIAYTQEVAARTEQYWCPIKHAQKRSGQHNRYHQFTDYGDAEKYRDKLEKLQRHFD